MFKCLRPRKIVNKYTGHDVIVDCGECDMCRSNKAAHYTQLTTLLSHQYRYCLFVTLTYDPKYVPLCSAEVEFVPEVRVKNKYIGDKVIPEHYIYHFFSDCDRLGETGELISSYESPGLDELYQLEEICHIGSNQFSYCSMRDIQNFHKRFRSRSIRLLKKYNIENAEEVCKYKHFTAFDYGGRRLRAHYHGLFCFDSSVLLFLFGKILREAWPFGRVDYSLSRGGAERYVANYVNSSVIVPKILKTGRFKVKQAHSVGLTKSLFKGRYEELYWQESRQLIEVGTTVGKQADPVIMQGDVSSIVFPKCLNVACSTYDELYKFCTVFKDAVQYCSIAKQRLGWKFDHFDTVISLADFLSFEVCDESCHAPLVCDIRFWLNLPLTYAYRFKIRDFIYRLLLTSKRFFDILDQTTHEWIDSDYSAVRTAVLKLYDFYYCLSMRQLSEWYEDMEEKLNDSALWLTVLFLFDNFITTRCRIKQNLFSCSEKHRFFRFIEAFPMDDFHLDVGNLRFINDIEFKNRFARSQLKMIRHLKHKQIINKFY